MISLMPPTPPDLSRPYGSPRERAADAENLVAYWYALEALVALSRLQPDDWSSTQAALMRDFPPGGGDTGQTSDARARRMRRWASLYSEELELIQVVRNRLVHGDIVTDPELLGATWLARQVLATVSGTQTGEIDQVWARSVAARAGA